MNRPRIKRHALLERNRLHVDGGDPTPESFLPE
jgi:hypothetical protein